MCYETYGTRFQWMTLFFFSYCNKCRWWYLKKKIFLNNEVGDSTTSQHFCFSVCHSASKGSKMQHSVLWNVKQMKENAMVWMRSFHLSRSKSSTDRELPFRTRTHSETGLKTRNTRVVDFKTILCLPKVVAQYFLAEYSKSPYTIPTMKAVFPCSLSSQIQCFVLELLRS